MSKSENLVLMIAGLASLFMVLSRRTLSLPGAALSAAETAALAQRIINENNFHVDLGMLTTIAEIESSRNPLALRYEPALNDASIGLMQTLLSTARWLAADMGYARHGIPDLSDLLDAEKSMYFGAAYLNWLSRYKGQTRSERWIVMSYNGGPGNDNPMTRHYFEKYQLARYGIRPADDSAGGALNDVGGA